MPSQDRTRVSLRLNNVDYGDWDTMTGREVTSTGDKYRPGPGKAERAFGGPSSYADIVLSRTYLEEVDGPIYKTFVQYAARLSGSITEQPLDIDYNVFGSKTTWPVRFQGVKRPDVDIMSGNRKIIEVTFWVDGDPT
jgi:hypothetical protein